MARAAATLIYWPIWRCCAAHYSVYWQSTFLIGRCRKFVNNSIPAQRTPSNFWRHDHLKTKDPGIGASVPVTVVSAVVALLFGRIGSAAGRRCAAVLLALV